MKSSPSFLAHEATAYAKAMTQHKFGRFYWTTSGRMRCATHSTSDVPPQHMNAEREVGTSTCHALAPMRALSGRSRRSKQIRSQLPQ